GVFRPSGKPALQWSASCGTSAHVDREFDRAVRQALLGERMALSTGFEFSLFASIGLQKSIELLWLTPSAVVVVELQRALRRVADEGVPPTGQLHGQPLHTAAEELDLTVRRWRPSQSLTSGRDGRRIADLRLNRNNVGQ